jgi:hypothetical protein
LRLLTPWKAGCVPSGFAQSTTFVPERRLASLFVYHTNKNCKGVSAISKKQGALRLLAGAVTTPLAVGMAGFFRTLCLADAGLNGELAALTPRHGAMRFAYGALPPLAFAKKTGKYRGERPAGSPDRRFALLRSRFCGNGTPVRERR